MTVFIIHYIAYANIISVYGELPSGDIFIILSPDGGGVNINSLIIGNKSWVSTDLIYYRAA